MALDDLRRLARPREPSPFLVALVYAGLEDNDRAFEWLEKAVQARSWELPTLKASPVFDNLRSDPRFPEDGRQYVVIDGIEAVGTISRITRDAVVQRRFHFLHRAKNQQAQGRHNGPGQTRVKLNSFEARYPCL